MPITYYTQEEFENLQQELENAEKLLILNNAEQVAKLKSFIREHKDKSPKEFKKTMLGLIAF